MAGRPASRVAIIGAGPSGLSLLRAFALAEKSGAKIPEIVCFEKQGDWGGLWNYTWRTGVDEHGDPVHSSMYRHLYTNLPKEYHEFPDYTYDQHFSKPVPSYLPRREILEYLLGRLKDVDIRRKIQFKTTVRFVEFEEEEDLFTVRVENLESGKTHVEKFDNVVVAVGHFSVPNVPQFEGMAEFPGRVVHSHDFRDAQEYSGQDVLIVGGSYSAEDIGLQFYKFGAKSVTISYRTKPLEHKWPQEIVEVPLLTKLVGKTAHFKDGSQRDVDSIILCTGYRHHFPFMDDDLRLFTRNRLYPDNLYKGIFFQNEPRVSYLGMQKFYFSFPGIDAQVWYVRDVLLGRITLPDAETRAKEAAEWQAREALVNGFLDGVNYMSAYVGELLAATDYPPVDLKGSAEKLEAVVRDKAEDIVRYRDKSHPSHINGTRAAINPTPWIDYKEDASKDV